MTPAEAKKAVSKFEFEEPIEIRMEDRNRNRMVYLGVPGADGAIRHQLTNQAGMSVAMENASGRNTGWYPRKNIDGWQAEMLDWFDSGYWTIVEVR